MIPFWIRLTLKNTWGYLTFKYTLIVCLCLLAVYIQMAYRVPSHFLFLLLPWISVALSALNIILLIKHLLVHVSTDDPFRQVFRRIEWGAGLLVRVFVYYSLFLYANGVLDHSIPADQHSEVLDIVGEEINIGRIIPLSWVELSSWKDPQGNERLLLRREEEEALWTGQPVVVQIRQGYFRVPWVSRLERDEEKYSRQVLKLVPTASEVWKRLINFYLNHQRWEEANVAAQDYLKIYPNDYDFALSTAAAFGVSYHNTEAVALLESFLVQRPNYELYNLVGWGLSKMGNLTRAIELLEASIPLDPANFWAYYHLGYVYRDMGKVEESMAMFEKVLERRPNYPEVEQQLAILRQRMAALQPKQRPK